MIERLNSEKEIKGGRAFIAQFIYARVLHESSVMDPAKMLLALVSSFASPRAGVPQFNDVSI